MNHQELPPHSIVLDKLEAAQEVLGSRLGSGRNRKYARFVVAALSSIPWVGGVIGASASLSAEKDQEEINELHRMWLAEHQERARELVAALVDIFSRLESFGDEVQERIESPTYLNLVKKCFHSWDEADTQEKKQMLKKLITNAAAIKMCPDDLVRLFIAWIDQYHEAHFLVIKEIYHHPGSTRGQIWNKIHGPRPREDSSEADLFRYLIRDLSTGGVVRQERETDGFGNFLKRDTRGQSRHSASNVMESSFEDTKPYVLTALGKQFVHYVMDDVVPQIGARGTQFSGDSG
jgi:hypothetical protein